jgi:hypothetical protein
MPAHNWLDMQQYPISSPPERLITIHSSRQSSGAASLLTPPDLWRRQSSGAHYPQMINAFGLFPTALFSIL